MRQHVLRGMDETPPRLRSGQIAKGRRVRDLEKELRRMDAALAETAATMAAGDPKAIRPTLSGDAGGLGS